MMLQKSGAVCVMVMQPVSVEIKPVYGDAASDVHAICVYSASGAVCVFGVQSVMVMQSLSMVTPYDAHAAFFYGARVIRCSLCLW